MQTAIKAALPLFRVVRRAPLRTALFATASIVALSASPRAEAQNECGLPVAGAVTCPVDAVGPAYPAGITYDAAEDLTVTFDDGVGVVAPAGVTVTNSAGNGAVAAPNVTVVTSGAGILVENSGDGDATINAGGAITGAAAGVRATTAGVGNASATFTGGTVNSTTSGVTAEATGEGNATASAGGTVTIVGNGGIGVGAVTTSGDASATSTGAVSVNGAGSFGVSAMSETGAASATGGTVTTAGDGSLGVSAASSEGAASASATGPVSTSGAGSHGVAANSELAAATAAAASVTTTGDGSFGVYAASAEGDANASATGLVSTAGAATHGVVAQSELGAATAAAADVTTTGDGSFGVYAASTEGAVTASATGPVSTSGAGSHGLVAQADVGAATVSAAAISTTGDGSIGVLATSTSGDVAITTGAVTTTGAGSSAILAETDGALTITTTGASSTAGAATNGIQATSTTGPIVIDAGGMSVTGEGSNAIVATTDTTIDLNVNGAVSGGWNAAPDPLLGTGAVLSAGESITVDVAAGGSLGALSDSALTAESPAITVNNGGEIVGYVNLTGDTVTFNNTSSTSFDLRNFADTDGDGVRDTEAASISNFGGAGVINNTGAVNLLFVGAPLAVNPLDAIELPIVIPESPYNIENIGVEHAALLGVSEFHNSGLINMQDATTGGSGPVAGDVMLIAGTGGEEPTVATYFSDGGALALDTVLNQGGSGNSISDILILQATEVGPGGPTLVQIANAGGTGAQTVEDGILLVHVTDPELSASGVFALDGYLIEGAYQYQLFQGGDADTGGDPLDGNWYLRSDLSPTAEVYRALPGSMLAFSRESIGTLQRRVGNRWWHTPERQVERTVTDPAPPPPPAATCPQVDFTVYFEWDKYNLNPEANETIGAALQRARACSVSQVMVIGHTDTSGPEDYNQALSERRANVVRDALAGGGIGVAIQVEGRGEHDLAVQTPDGVREPLNRRSAVTIRIQGSPTVAAGPPPQPRTRTVIDTIPASTEVQGAGVWGRIVGSEGEFEPEDGTSSRDDSLWMAQAGVDFLLMQDGSGSVIGSVFAHYGESTSDVSTEDFGEVAQIDHTGMGVGGSVTWYSPEGHYVDGTVVFNWFETDIDSAELGILAEENDGTSWAISAEGGYRIETAPNYAVIPQAQLTYASADFDDFTDGFNGTVAIDDDDSLIGRLGVAFEYAARTDTDSGSVSRIQGYGVASILYDFMGNTGVTLNDVSLEDEQDEVWGEFAGGFTYGFDAAWTLYGEAGYRTSLESWGDSEQVYGSLGVRYNW